MRLANTDDGGHSWRWVSGHNLPAVNASDHWQVRFADPQSGWIFGSLLFATHDGGRTWARVAIPHLGSSNALVGALEAAGGRVFAEVAEGMDADTYGPVVLFSSAAASDAWSAVGSVATGQAGYPGEISAAGGAVWVMVHPGLVSLDHLVTTQSALFASPDGVSWHAAALPCPDDSVASVAAASRGRVFIVCAGGVAAGSQDKTAFLSSDGGASYTRAGDPPFSGDFTAAAASPSALAVGAASGATFIYTSFNDGHDWSTTTLPQTGGVPLSDLRFVTATEGVAIFGASGSAHSELLMTRDGGLSWVKTGVSPS
jgi:photosystem II stability/assembly factor-like uncharacterized protein